MKKIINQRGFTILEVVFAISILAIGIFGYTTLKSTNRYSRTYSKGLSQAVQLSSGQMEDFLARGYDNALLVGDVDAPVSSDVYTELSDELKVEQFQIDEASLIVKEGCPSELTKLIIFNTVWNKSAAEDSTLTITQVQQRP